MISYPMRKYRTFDKRLERYFLGNFEINSPNKKLAEHNIEHRRIFSEAFAFIILIVYNEG